MDSLTHIVLGAAIGEAVAGKRAGRQAMAWGALAGSAPDIDAVTSFFTDDVGSLVLHRGITHSLFVALIAGPLLGWWFYRMNRARGVTFGQMAWLFTLGIVSHDLLDACTIYGTGLLNPFSETRFSFDNIFVADPLYTLPLLISGGVIFFGRLGMESRRKWNMTGLVLSTAYLSLTFVTKSNAEAAFSRSLDSKGIEAEDRFSAPTLLNSVAWNLVAKDGDGFWIGYWSAFQDADTCSLYFIPGNDSLLGEMQRNSDVQQLKKFSKGFYCITYEDNRYWFNDLRFGQVGGWADPTSPFAFSFDLSVGADNSIVIQRGRIEGSRRDMLASLWSFIRQD